MHPPSASQPIPSPDRASGPVPGVVSPVRVLMVEDDPLVRTCLRDILDGMPGLDRFALVGEAGTGEEALRLAGELRPDLVLLDLGLPNLDGVEVARHLRTAQPDARILALTCAPADDPRVGALVRLGVEGYLRKDAGPEAIADAIRTVASGRTCLPSAALRCAAEPDEAPSAREWQVLRLVDQGCGNREIGQRLAISEDTVAYHLRNLFGKLGAISRTDMLRLARQRGWLR